MLSSLNLHHYCYNLTLHHNNSLFQYQTIMRSTNLTAHKCNPRSGTLSSLFVIFFGDIFNQQVDGIYDMYNTRWMAFNCDDNQSTYPVCQLPQNIVFYFVLSSNALDFATTKRINAICNNFLSFPVATENVILFSINTSDSKNVFSLFQMAQDSCPEERVEIVCYICAKVFFVCFCLLHLC